MGFSYSNSSGGAALPYKKLVILATLNTIGGDFDVTELENSTGLSFTYYNNGAASLVIDGPSLCFSPYGKTAILAGPGYCDISSGSGPGALSMQQLSDHEMLVATEIAGSPSEQGFQRTTVEVRIYP